MVHKRANWHKTCLEISKTWVERAMYGHKNVMYGIRSIDQDHAQDTWLRTKL
jgi:hypothetical protein